MSVAADALGLLRLVAAGAFPAALDRAVGAPAGGVAPFALVALAAASDYCDGLFARRSQTPTRHGAVLDTVADVAFVLAATGSGAALGLVPWAVPISIGVAVGAYALASLRRSTRRGAWQLARSRVGHAAGVCNYGLASLIAATVAMPQVGWSVVLEGASLAVIGVNLAAALEHACRGSR